MLNVATTLQNAADQGEACEFLRALGSPELAKAADLLAARPDLYTEVLEYAAEEAAANGLCPEAESFDRPGLPAPRIVLEVYLDQIANYAAPWPEQVEQEYQVHKMLLALAEDRRDIKELQEGLRTIKRMLVAALMNGTPADGEQDRLKKLGMAGYDIASDLDVTFAQAQAAAKEAGLLD